MPNDVTLHKIVGLNAISDGRPQPDTFYGIERAVEQEIAELYAFRDECETDEERAAVDKAIREYVNPKEVAKIDGLRAFMKHCGVAIAAAKEEARVQDARAKAWQARLDWLKQYILGIAEVLGKKRFDGKTGYLLVRGNGGQQALTITDESLVPDEFCEYTLTLSAKQMKNLVRIFEVACATFQCENETRSVRNDLVRKALSEPCPNCNGAKELMLHTSEGSHMIPCGGCGGEGTRRVPGARLEARGVSLVVK